MRAFSIMLCCAVLLSAVGIARHQDSAKARTKKTSVATAPATSSSTKAVESSDERVGTTKGGSVVYRGKKGGLYVLTPNGKKRYVKESQVIFDEKK
ncbi:MAG: hypothetical protein N3B17_00500 [Chlorobi bacterium]|nr:hypothetical protein [Chlorobiota bacterium]